MSTGTTTTFTAATAPTTDLTALETLVYTALVENAGACSGGDFACAEEVDTKVLKLTKAQFGALLTTLQAKRVIGVDITFVNQGYVRSSRSRTGWSFSKGTKVTQVSFYIRDNEGQPAEASDLAKWVRIEGAATCERCGGVKPVGQSCGCFDNDSQ